MLEKQKTRAAKTRVNDRYLTGFQPAFIDLAAFVSEINWNSPSAAAKILGNSRKNVILLSKLLSPGDDLGLETREGSGLYHPIKRVFEGGKYDGSRNGD